MSLIKGQTSKLLLRGRRVEPGNVNNKCAASRIDRSEGQGSGGGGWSGAFSHGGGEGRCRAFSRGGGE